MDKKQIKLTTKNRVSIKSMVIVLVGLGVVSLFSFLVIISGQKPEERQTLPIVSQPPPIEQVQLDEKVKNLNSKFLKANNANKSASDVKSKLQFSQALKDVILERSDAMLLLMASDPETANQLALEERDISGLPPGLRNKIEKSIEVEGILEVFHQDNFEQGTSLMQFFLDDGKGKRYEVHFPQILVPLVSNSRIRVKGIELEGNIAAAEGDESVAVLELAAAAPVNENIAVILVNFLNDTSEPWTTAFVNDVIFNQTASYYTENSFSKVTLTGDIFGYYTLPINRTCSYIDIRNAAIQAADPDIYFPDYTQIMFVGSMSGCGWGGLAYVGDVTNSTDDGFVIVGNSWIASMTSRVVGHELGHTFGVWHANFYNCGLETLSDTGCSSLNYGDIFDIMGNGPTTHMNGYHKEKLGFFDASNIIEVSSSGSYTIEPIENITTAPQVLKLDIGSGKFIYIDYRQPIGVDSLWAVSWWILDGAMFHIAPWRLGSGDTQLLDMTPTSPSSRADVTLDVGNSFTIAGIATITPTAQSAAEISLDITLFPPIVDVKVGGEFGASDGPVSLIAPTQYSISWVANSSACTKSGSWSGVGGSVGNELFNVISNTGTYIYTVTCSNGAGSTSDSVTVTITEPTVVPIVDLLPDGPITLIAPAWISLLWNASYATSGCTNSGDWAGFAHSFYYGGFTSIPIGTYTYNVTCTNSIGSASDSLVVNVIESDITPPTVSIIFPLDGTTVSSTTSVNISAFDASGINVVDIYIDGVLEASLFGVPYGYSWDTTSFSNGTHTLVAEAYDVFSNMATSLPVTVTVDNFIDVTPPTTAITSPANGSTVSDTITISATAFDDVDVVSVSFYVDEILLGSDTSAPYSFSWDTITAANGSHALKSRATDSSGNIGESVSVSVLVSNIVIDSSPPLVVITNPADQGSVTRRSNIAITVSASDNVGVTKVEFYVNGSLVCTDSILAYSCNWRVPGKRNASYAISARAYDPAGNTASHSITVNEGEGGGDTISPTTTITSPVDGATVSNTIAISATASDNVAVSSVSFLLDNAVIGTDTTEPYSLVWNTASASNGSHTLQSRAIDSSGNTGESEFITVTVSNGGGGGGDTISPAVSVTNPANGSTVSRRSTVTITASASDNVGVTRVLFYVKNSLICTDTVSPYNCAWKVTGKPNASYTIQAKAYDAAGNSNTNSVNVTSN